MTSIERRLAGAVGPDQEAQLALLDRQVDAVDGLEAVEVDDHAAERRAAAVAHGAASRERIDRRRDRRRHRIGVAPARQALRRSSLTSPTMPAGDEGHHDDEQQALDVLPVVGPLLADRRRRPS